MMDTNKFFGVFIPKDDGFDLNSNENFHVYTCYEDAHKIIKEHKNARFKGFNTEKEASYFAKYGSASGPGNPNVVCESISYKSLKRPEIYQFRKYIEVNDLKSIESLVMKNPRYLIGIGDTPTIMQEGPRYNALHFAAKYDRSDIADFILRTVGDESFCQKLYGAAGGDSYIIRPDELLDLYLNTPDKALNETPLHFAAKYGAYDVILVFVQYSKLQLQVKNKYGQTPKDVTFNMVNHENQKVTINEMHKLLDELYYVPVWRSDDEVVQPIIGKPYSPKSPAICPLETSPLSPNMKITGVAGPMNYEEATNFHKMWKLPAKSPNCSTPNQGRLLRSPLNSAKEHEQVGRSLAKKSHIPWKEDWPFLNCSIDLSTEKGLVLLNDFLKRKAQSSVVPEEISITSPEHELCASFSKFSINSTAASQVRNMKARSRVTRKIDFSFDENDNINEKYAVPKVTNFFANCGSNSCDIGSNDTDSDDDFHSAPSSPADSEDEWESADEGPDLYIIDNKGNCMDNAVLEAISDVDIDPAKYPFIYQWKHFKNSSSKVQRANWPSPNATPYKRMKLMNGNT